MKKIFSILFLLAFFSLAKNETFASVIYEDMFTGSNGTTIQANNTDWHNFTSGFAQIRISSNNAVADSGNNSGYSLSAFTIQDACFQVDYLVRAGQSEFFDFYIRNSTLEWDPNVNTIQFWFDGDGTGFTRAYINGTSQDGTFPTGITNDWHTLTGCQFGTTFSWYIDNVKHGELTDPDPVTSGYPGISSGTVGQPGGLTFDNFRVLDSNPFEETDSTIGAFSTSSTVTVGVPFSVDVVAQSGSEAFNALRSTVAISSNLTITGLANSTSNSCNMQYTQTPTTSNPSFAGGIFGTSSNQCTVYTLTLTPNASGSGTVAFTNASMKAYVDNSEILSGVTDVEFTIAEATPSPSPEFSEFTISSVLPTYASEITLLGNKNASIVKIFVNESDLNSIYPTNTTWENTVSLVLGANVFNIYGKNAEEVQTATQNITVNRHTLGDINGDGEVDLIDASLFAVDWDKTENLTYALSDMNDDQVVDLTDLSILAKLL